MMLWAEVKDSVSKSMARAGHGENSPQETKGPGREHAGELQKRRPHGGTQDVRGAPQRGKGHELHRSREGWNTGTRGSLTGWLHTALSGTSAIHLLGT